MTEVEQGLQDLNTPASAEEPAKAFDDIRHLYVAQVSRPEPESEAGGHVEVNGSAQEARFWGEVLLYGQPRDGTFVVERLRRIALYGVLEDPAYDDGIGVLSLAGPLEEVELEPGSSGSSDVRLMLHYNALSVEHEPRRRSEDAVFPQVEDIRARFTWGSADPVGETRVRMEVSLDAYELVKTLSGRVRAVRPTLGVLEFNLAGSGTYEVKFHNPLVPQCPLPPAQSNTEDMRSVQRRLPLRFVDLTLLYPGNLEALCNRLLRGLGPGNPIRGVCEVWRNKAALDLVVDTTIVKASLDHKNGNSLLGTTQEYELRLLGYASENQVEVYLVDTFEADHGGGIAYNCGTAEAFCILDVGKAENNAYLLAHELGHVLGLDHPGFGSHPGTAGSIMETGDPNPAINTLANCEIFTDTIEAGEELPLNPIVETTTITDYFHPDP